MGLEAEKWASRLGGGGCRGEEEGEGAALMGLITYVFTHMGNFLLLLLLLLLLLGFGP